MKYVVYGVYYGRSNWSPIYSVDASKHSYEDVVNLAIEIDNDPKFEGRISHIEEEED
jgi:hypothetical protein